MARSLYVSILLALALVAGHSEAATADTNAITRRQQGGVAGFGSPFGSSGSGGSYSSSYQHSESHSTQTVANTYNGLLGSIQSCQNSFQQSGFTYESASQEIQQLATQFQLAFSQFNSCGSCHSQDQIFNFRQTFSSVFQSFQSLIQECEQRFPDRWNQFFSRSFVGIQNDFSQFFGNCQRAGLQLNTFVPQQLGSFFHKTEMRSASSFLQRSGFSF